MMTFDELLEAYRTEEVGIHTLSTIIVSRFLTPESLDEILAALPVEARADLERWLSADDFATGVWLVAGIAHVPPPPAVAAAALFRARRGV